MQPLQGGGEPAIAYRRGICEAAAHKDVASCPDTNAALGDERHLCGDGGSIYQIFNVEGAGRHCLSGVDKVARF